MFSTHVVEDLAAACDPTCNYAQRQLFYMRSSMKNLVEEAIGGQNLICKVPEEGKAREIERKYRITSKQYVEGGLQLRVISEIQPSWNACQYLQHWRMHISM